MSKQIEKIWKSNTNGRSIFGWIIKEEIFAIFFILVILSLANDEKIIKKVNQNMYIQIFIALIIIYCIYNKIPWSLAFILVFIVSVLFSGLLKNSKESLKKIFSNNTSSKEHTFRELGAKVLSWMSKDNISKSILKKVNFENMDSNNSNSNSDNEECKKASKYFQFTSDENSDVDTDVDTDIDTDVDTDVDTDINTDIDTGVDTDVDTYIDTNINTYIDTKVNNINYKEMLKESLNK